MAVSQANLYFSRGDTFTFSVLAQDYQQAVINLTGASITLTVKRGPSYSTLFTRTLGAGIAVTNAAAGTFTVTIAPANTSSLPDIPQVLQYDLQVTSAAGAVTSVQSGSIYLAADLT